MLNGHSLCLRDGRYIFNINDDDDDDDEDSLYDINTKSKYYIETLVQQKRLRLEIKLILRYTK